MIRNRARWVAGRQTVAALAVAGSLVACGGGGKPAGTTTPLTDRTAAGRLLLGARDFPAGWTASKPDDQTRAVTATQMATCMGATDPALHSASVQGDDYAKGGAEVSVSVAYVPTRHDFETDAAALRSAKYESCYRSVQGRSRRDRLAAQPGGATLLSIAVAKRTAPTYGDVTVVVRATIRLRNAGNDTVLYVDDYSYGKGRAEVDLSFSSEGKPFDPALERRLVGIATGKLEQVQ